MNKNKQHTFWDAAYFYSSSLISLPFTLAHIPSLSLHLVSRPFLTAELISLVHSACSNCFTVFCVIRKAAVREIIIDTPEAANVPHMMNFNFLKTSFYSFI